MHSKIIASLFCANWRFVETVQVPHFFSDENVNFVVGVVQKRIVNDLLEYKNTENTI